MHGADNHGCIRRLPVGSGESRVAERRARRVWHRGAARKPQCGHCADATPRPSPRHALPSLRLVAARVARGVGNSRDRGCPLYVSGFAMPGAEIAQTRLTKRTKPGR